METFENFLTAVWAMRYWIGLVAIVIGAAGYVEHLNRPLTDDLESHES